MKCFYCAHRLWIQIPGIKTKRRHVLLCSALECKNPYIDSLLRLDALKKNGYNMNDIIKLCDEYDVVILGDFASEDEVEVFTPTKFCRRQDPVLLSKMKQEYWRL